MSANLSRPTSADLADCAPELRGAVQLVIADLQSQGFAPVVYETWRAPERAAYLGRHGYSQRGARSRHCATAADGSRAAEAVDLIDGRKGADGKLIAWGASDPGTSEEIAENRAAAAMAFFHALGNAARAHGLTWGGSWRMRDYAHVELS